MCSLRTCATTCPNTGYSATRCRPERQDIQTAAATTTRLCNRRSGGSASSRMLDSDQLSDPHSNLRITHVGTGLSSRRTFKIDQTKGSISFFASLDQIGRSAPPAGGVLLVQSCKACENRVVGVESSDDLGNDPMGIASGMRQICEALPLIAYHVAIAD